MSTPEFWIFPIALLGACVGSFLNVVIFRLPRGLSVAQPRWSFCPQCEHRIRAYDNIPVFGWLLLAGKCRDCRLAIPPMYPVVEALTALLFVVIWDVACVARVTPVSTIAVIWPMAASLLFLFSSLMAMSVMDLETYTVDIRLCDASVAVGVICYSIWGLTDDQTTARLMPAIDDSLPPAVVVAAVAAAAAWAIWSKAATIFKKSDPIEFEQEPSPQNDVPAASDSPPGQNVVSSPTAGKPSTEKAAAVLGVVTLGAIAVGACVWIYWFPSWPDGLAVSPGQVRGLAALFVFMTALIAASITPREADAMVVDEIESQRAEARSMALREFAGFLPSLIAAGMAIWWLHSQSRLAEEWTSTSGIPFFSPTSPGGAPWALNMHMIASAALAATLGWTVRILGTLAFGKEAFGTGDIYILAAIGAAAGLSIAIIGFFLAAFLALAGVAIMLVRKRSKAVPFGPWLALGAFLALYLRPPLMNTVNPVLRFIWGRLTGQPDFL